jgi:hypothetical protein
MHCECHMVPPGRCTLAAACECALRGRPLSLATMLVHHVHVTRGTGDLFEPPSAAVAAPESILAAHVSQLSVLVSSLEPSVS